MSVFQAVIDGTAARLKDVTKDLPYEIYDPSSRADALSNFVRLVEGVRSRAVRRPQRRNDFFQGLGFSNTFVFYSVFTF